jgi:hypothetical protein
VVPQKGLERLYAAGIRLQAPQNGEDDRQDDDDHENDEQQVNHGEAPNGF